MRLFIALELPPSVKEALVGQQRLLQTALVRDERLVRWVDSATMHLTLQFLGEVPDETVPAVVACVRLHRSEEVAQHQLALGRVGAFPNLRRPQTLWCAVGGDLAALSALQQVLGHDLVLLGFPPEQRPFSPHLTLGRVRRDATPAQQAALGLAVRAVAPPPPITWQCGPPVLFQSTLTPQGPIYAPLSR